MRPGKPRDTPLETSERLLNTAERLFAKYGFDGVGMRALAEEAQVNLGATTYHYGSKERLYIETFQRRFRPANEARLSLLREAESAAAGKPLEVETIIDCLLRPPFYTVLNHPHFPPLLARNLFMPPPFMKDLVDKEILPGLEHFIQALSFSLPDVPIDLIRLRLMLTSGSLLMFAGQMGRLPDTTKKNPVFVESALKELIRFTSSGFLSAPAIPSNLRPPFPLPTPFTPSKS